MEDRDAHMKIQGGRKGGMWGYQYTSIGCSRINEKSKQDVEVGDGYLDQGQENWGVLRSEDPQIDLNSFRTKVELARGARSQCKFTGNCAACHNRCTMIY